MAQTFTDRVEQKNGSDLTGSNGQSGRTYTLVHSDYVPNSLKVYINGTFLHEGSSNDFTVAGSVVTFNNVIFDTQTIDLHYQTFASVSVTGTDLKYTTTLKLATMLLLVRRVPSPAVGDSPVKENVGTGDNTETAFYLDHGQIIADTYTLYHGATINAATTELTETTHYTLDKSTGAITLTAAGVTEVGTNVIGAEYKYFGVDNVVFDNDYFQDVLLRAEQEVDSETNTTFVDTTVDNPAFQKITDELHPSRGAWDKEYFSENRPVKDLNTTLQTTITSSDTTLDVAAGQGVNFPTTGRIIIGTEIIDYSGVSTDTLQNLTRGVNGSTAAAHTAGDHIHTIGVEVSATVEGGTPTWTVLEWHDQVTVDKNGHVHVMDNQVLIDSLAVSPTTVKADVPDRLRLFYFWGVDSVPQDIVRLALLFAKRQLMQDNIGRAIIIGRNEFKPEMFNADEKEINMILDSYRRLPMGNT